MTIDNQLNKLREIQQVEAPAFLLTRINQQIAQYTKSISSCKMEIGICISGYYIAYCKCVGFYSI
jgi:hypothetical protein